MPASWYGPDPHGTETNQDVRRVAGRRRRGAGGAGRLGRILARPRRHPLPQPARPLRGHAGGGGRVFAAGGARGGGRAARRVLHRGGRRGAAAPRRHGQRRPGHRRDRAGRDGDRGAVGLRPAAVRDRRHGRRTRGVAPDLSLPGSALRRHAAQPGPAQRRHRRGARGARRPALPGGGDPHHDALHPGGRARLHRAVPSVPRELLRAAAVAADLQAAPDGQRAGPLLPDCPLLPGRGHARRPPAGVHADRP